MPMLFSATIGAVIPATPLVSVGALPSVPNNQCD